jgi:hypothetical protein
MGAIGVGDALDGCAVAAWRGTAFGVDACDTTGGIVRGGVGEKAAGMRHREATLEDLLR